MPRRHRAVQPPYRRNVPTTTSLLDVADQVYHAGALDWSDVQAAEFGRRKAARDANA